MGEITVDPNGVLKLLNGLKVHKTIGPDGLSARVLKECSSEIAPILYMSYSDALKNSFFPRTIPLWNSLPSSVVHLRPRKNLRLLFRTKGPEVYVLVCLSSISCK